MARDFGTWKSQMIAWLIQLPSKGKRETYDFDQQRNALIDKLDNLRSRWLASFLADLHRFCSFWGIQIPRELLPTQEEIESWRFQFSF